MHGVVGWTELQHDTLAQRLVALRAAGPLLGLRVMLNRRPDVQWINRPAVVRGMRTPAAAGSSLDLNVEPAHQQSRRAALVQVPVLRAVVSHGATPPIHAAFLRDAA